MRLGDRQHRHVDDHLVVAHVVTLGQLDNAIQDHRVAEELGLDELQVLVLCLFICKDSPDMQSLAIIRMQFLSEPDAHRRRSAPSACVD